MRPLKSTLRYLIAAALLLAAVSAGKIERYGPNYLKAYAGNLGEETFYEFNFNVQSEIKTNANIQIIFPQEFNALSFSENLECYFQGGGQFRSSPCTYASGNYITLSVGTILAGVQGVIIGLVTNPASISQSSNFRLTTLYQDVVIDRNEVYGIVSFASAPSKLAFVRTTQPALRGSPPPLATRLDAQRPSADSYFWDL